LQQIGISAGIFLGNLSLESAGYITPQVMDGVMQSVQQPDSVLLVLRLIVSLIPAVVLALSIPLAIAYPITRQRHDEIRAKLAERS
jgi:GPH family glycoside/pentoside/hexuronide:cation symporter